MDGFYNNDKHRYNWRLPTPIYLHVAIFSFPIFSHLQVNFWRCCRIFDPFDAVAQTWGDYMVVSTYSIFKMAAIQEILGTFSLNFIFILRISPILDIFHLIILPLVWTFLGSRKRYWCLLLVVFQGRNILLFGNCCSKLVFKKAISKHLTTQ